MALKDCPECGKQISDVAQSCPYCGYPINPPVIRSQPMLPKPKRHNGCWIALIVVVVIICLIIGLLSYLAAGIDLDSDIELNEEGKPLVAYNCAEDYITKNLNLCSPAKFPDDKEKKEDALYLINGMYHISSWIETKDSAGQKIRFEFTCTVTITGDSGECSQLMLMLE